MSETKTSYRIVLLQLAALVVFAPAICSQAVAQGPVIVLSPGDTIHSVAGNGAKTFSGDNGAAISAALSSPSALAADAAGNIFVADTTNHRIRRIDPNGNITTVAGNGTQGFFGDGGPATSASLNTPSGLAVDASGSLYIADSSNHRIRVVANGTITTFAGNGLAAYSGDNGAASSASLNNPMGVAVDTAGDVYVADTNNHVIRKISAGTITTIAGNAEQGFFGDNGPATSASLNSPTAVALASGNIFIADSENHRIRKVSGGTITTVAGSGAAGYSGDGGPAIGAALNLPNGISLDSTGNIYVADSSNHVVRRVNSGTGTITTIVANGEQGFSGDNGPPAVASFDTPSAALPWNGTVLIADRNNQRIRRADATVLTFANQIVGTASAAQTVTVSNVGSSAITLAAATPSSADFALAATGSCGNSFPHAIAAGSSCTLDLLFNPGALGAVTGSISITDNAQGSPHAINATGNGVQDGTSTVLGSSLPTSIYGGPVTVTATITPTVATAAPAPTGTVSFSEGATTLATNPLSVGTASFSTASLAPGAHTITASYSGDALYTASSTSFMQTVNQNLLTIAANSAARTYGAANPALAGTVGPTQNGEVITATYSTSATVASNVGSYPIVPTPAGAALGNYIVTLVNGTLTVNPAALAVTANNKTRVYGAANPSFDAVITGIQNGDNISATFATPATAASNVGSYAIVPSPAGAALANYAVTLANGTLAITPAPTLVVVSAGSSNPALINTLVTLTATVASSTSGSPTGSVTFKDGGTTLGTSNLNASGTASLSTSFTTLGAHAITVVYGGDANFSANTSAALPENIVTQDFAVTATPAALNLKAGQSGTVSITVTPQFGFNGTVNLSCGNLPQFVTCTFTPASLTPSSGPVTASLSIKTSGPNAVLQAPRPVNGGGDQPLNAWLSLSSVGLAGLVLAAGASRGPRKRKFARKWTILGCGLLLCVLLLSIAGCGGGSMAPAPVQQTTPQGTTSATVTATAVAGSISLNHNASVTITVTP